MRRARAWIASERSPTVSIRTAVAANTAPGPSIAIIAAANSGPTKIASASVVLVNAFEAVSCAGVSASSGSADRWVGRTIEIVIVARAANV